MKRAHPFAYQKEQNYPLVLMTHYLFASNCRAIKLTNFFNKSRLDDPGSCFSALIKEIKALTNQSIKNR
jgi:hypothetical protein